MKSHVECTCGLKLANCPVCRLRKSSPSLYNQFFGPHATFVDAQPPPPPLPARKPKPRGTLRFYIVRRATGLYVLSAESKYEAILAASILAPDMASLRQQFLMTNTPPRRNEQWETWSGYCMPWGKFEGCRFRSIPTNYLDTIVGNPSVDRGLRARILRELRMRHDWRMTRKHAASREEEDGVASEYNYLRDFEPSELR